MFTGIVETVGELTELRIVSTGMRMKISAKNLDFSDVSLGDSIAVSGACLTVTSFSNSLEILRSSTRESTLRVFFSSKQ